MSRSFIHTHFMPIFLIFDIFPENNVRFLFIPKGFKNNDSSLHNAKTEKTATSTQYFILEFYLENR